MPLPALTEILSERLRLRPVRPDDLADLFEVNRDPEVTRFLPYATWQNAEDGQSWLQRMTVLAAAGTAQQLVLQRRDDGRVIGSALLFRLDEGSARAELGYALGRAHWHQGWMREALAALCGHAFGPAGLRRLEAEVNPANSASTNLLLSLGFTREGRLRQRWVGKGGTYDTDFFGLLSHEWPPARASDGRAR